MIRISFLLFLFSSFHVCVLAQNSQEQNIKLIEFYQNQQYKEAAEYMKSLQADTSYSFQTLNRLGYCYKMAKDYNNAIYYYQQAFEKDSTDIATLSNLAGIYHGKGNKLIAKEYYKRILQTDSNHVNTLQILGGLSKNELDSSGRNLATYYFGRAYELQSENIDLALDYALYLSDIEQFQTSNQILDEALQLDPDNYYLVHTKAQVTFKLKNYKEAIMYGEKLISLGGDLPEIITMMGRASYHLKDYKSSLGYYKKLTDNEKTLGEMDYYYMSISAKELKQYKEAIQYIDLALEQAISPNTAYYYGAKGDMHELNNEFTKAASALKTSFNYEVIPTNYYKLGLLYDFKIKNKQQATANYKKYLQQKTDAQDLEVLNYVKKRLESLK